MTALVMPPLPAPPSPPPRTPFPVIAVIAPAIGAVVILLITGSVFVLVFAALSPLIAVATSLDARRTARRHIRDEAARFERDCTAWLARVPELHALERARADAAHPPLHERLRSRDPEAEAGSFVRIGVAPAPSEIAPERPAVLDDGPVSRRLAELAAAAGTHPAMPVLAPAGPVRVVGRGRAAEAVARLVSLHPACAVEHVASAPVLSPLGATTSAPLEIVVDSPTTARLRLADGRETRIRPEGATRREHETLIRRRAPAEAALPEAVRWRDLASSDARAGAAPGAIGVDTEGIVELDLLGDAPHALVGGTTGSGKSEFLRTAALAWAAGGAPGERSILLVDFKGGSAFAELSALPHVVGLLTDLDAASAERALRSLRAEIRRREAVLRERGGRDVVELPAGVLARLLILVDEYAVLVESFPELQPLVADLAARGRSLGIHLILCTQRPAGVVRDAVAANCGIRIAFRMASSTDATGLLPVAPPPDGSPAGRALLSAAGRSRAIHVATIAAEDIAAVSSRWSSAHLAPRPWIPPLPASVSRADALALAAEGSDDESTRCSIASEREIDGPGGAGAAPAVDPWAPPASADAPVAPPAGPRLLLGAVDDPDRQRRARGEWAPDRDGALLVVGAQGSGTARALAVIAESAAAAACDPIVLPASPADALGVLAELRDEHDGSRSRRADAAADASAGADADGRRDGRPPHRDGDRPLILLVPDIDALVAEAGDRALDLLDALDGLDRRLRRRGGALVASCSSVLRSRPGVVGRFDSVLLLRAASADDHRAAGGAPADFDANAPRGRGRWRGRVIQLLEPESPAPRARSPRIPVWAPAALVPTAVVSARPAITAERLRRAGVDVATEPAAIDEPARGHRPRIAVADAETWQSAWSALALARREGAIVLVDASESDARAVLGARASIPLRDQSAIEEVVVVDAAGAIRARWPALG